MKTLVSLRNSLMDFDISLTEADQVSIIMDSFERNNMRRKGFLSINLSRPFVKSRSMIIMFIVQFLSTSILNYCNTFKRDRLRS